MKKIVFINLFFLIGIVSCESFDYVHVDNRTFYRQLLYLNNGFVAVVLKIDPKKEDDSINYSAPGKIIKEIVFEKKSVASSELIQLVLDIIKKNHRYTGEGWYPTYKLYIKYTDRFLYVIPLEKYLAAIFDFKNSIIFVEGRKFIFNQAEAELLKEKLDSLLKD